MRPAPHARRGKRRRAAAAALAVLVPLSAWGYWSGQGAAEIAAARLATLAAPALTATARAGAVELTWTKLTPPGGGEVKYYIKRVGGALGSGSNCPSTAASAKTEGELGGLKCKDEAVAVGETRTYTVTAVWRTWTVESAEKSATVTYGPITHFLLATTHSEVEAGAAENLTITAQDSSNRTVEEYAGSHSLTFEATHTAAPSGEQSYVTSESGSHIALNGAGLISFSGGVAQVSESHNGQLKLFDAASTTVTVKDGSGHEGSKTFTVKAGAFKSFHVESIPAEPTAGSAFEVKLTAWDEWHNVVATYARASGKKLLYSGAENAPNGTAAVYGSSEPTFASGTVTVSGFKFYKAASTTLKVEEETTLDKGEASMVVAAGAATQLPFTTQPAGAFAGYTFRTQPVVTAEDAYGNTVSSYSGTVSLSIKSGTGTGGAVLSGCSGSRSGGVTSFSGCQINLAGSGYQLNASDGSLTTASEAFEVTALTTVTKSTAGTYTLTVPAGVTFFKFTINGAGGGGGGGYTSGTAASGGGGGTVSGTITIPSSASATSFTVVVGGGGGGGAGSSGTHAGGAGGTGTSGCAAGGAGGTVSTYTAGGGGGAATCLYLQGAPANTIVTVGGGGGGGGYGSGTGGGGGGGPTSNPGTNTAGSGAESSGGGGGKSVTSGSFPFSPTNTAGTGGSNKEGNGATGGTCSGGTCGAGGSGGGGGNNGGGGGGGGMASGGGGGGGGTLAAGSGGGGGSAYTGGTQNGSSNYTVAVSSASNGGGGGAGGAGGSGGGSGSTGGAGSVTFTGPELGLSGALNHFSVSAPSEATAGGAFNVTITAQDSSNGTVTSYSGSQTIIFSGPSSSPNSNAPSYPVSVSFTNGVGIASITLYDAQSTTLTATQSSITGTSSSFTVKSASVSELEFTTQPAGATAGAAFTTQPVVTAEDAYGNTVSSYSGTVSLSIKSGTGTGGAVLSGCTGSRSGGVTSFSGCQINLAGSGYQLNASDGSLTATSEAFNVTTTVKKTTAGTYTLTVPAGITSFTFTINGAGGGGGGGYTTGTAASGGGGGTVSGTITIPSSASATSFTVVVGGAGGGGAGSGGTHAGGTGGTGATGCAAGGVGGTVSTYTAGGGGGAATCIYLQGAPANTIVTVGGGGGGGGYGSGTGGGGGGGPTSNPGTNTAGSGANAESTGGLGGQSVTSGSFPFSPTNTAGTGGTGGGNGNGTTAGPAAPAPAARAAPAAAGAPTAAAAVAADGLGRWWRRQRHSQSACGRRRRLGLHGRHAERLEQLHGRGELGQQRQRRRRWRRGAAAAVPAQPAAPARSASAAWA